MDETIVWFAIFGFIAQLIDGALGMGYGVSASSLLLALGVPPAAASAGVHTAEMFTTFVSGLSHWRFGNIEWRMVKRLLPAGVAGGIIGAYILTSFPGDKIKPWIALYLLGMGVLIIWKAVRKNHAERKMERGLVPLGLAGGFADAIGGGGWGPIVTSTLVANGNHPRTAVGSVNFTEFFVTVAQSVTFFLALGSLAYGKIILGLLLGGVVAAPFAARLTGKLPLAALKLAVGGLIVLLSLRTLLL